MVVDKGDGMSKTKKVCKAAEQVKGVVQNTQLGISVAFPCPIYLIERTDFLASVNEVSEESLAAHRKDQSADDLYPVSMSGSYLEDPRVAKFAEFVGATAWNILNEQGYVMQDKAVAFTEMWTQEHRRQSSMEQHTHGHGSQIVGFYFLEVPENSSRVVFHDPRIAKTMIDLPEQDQDQVTVASRMINFVPKKGLLIFANAWLAHSFTRHGSDSPLKFVHFNLVVQAVQPAPVCPAPAAEVV
jgi:uncharacterized protein (TIGR02466 family)